MSIFTLSSIHIPNPSPNLVICSYHFHDCPKERMIPIYLIVFGVAGLLKNLISLVKKLKAHIVGDDDATRDSTKETSCDNIITLFIVAWFIAGNVWIYRCALQEKITHGICQGL